MLKDEKTNKKLPKFKKQLEIWENIKTSLIECKSLNNQKT